MRVEWAKAHARSQRWVEEILLLNEEMRRVISFLDWKAGWWLSQLDRRSDVRSDIASGLQAYAHRQADLMRGLAKSFASLWYPLLSTSAISPKWLPAYTAHAIAHPIIPRPSRRQTKLEKKRAAQSDGDASSGMSSESSGDSGSDDEDLSPYR